MNVIKGCRKIILLLTVIMAVVFVPLGFFDDDDFWALGFFALVCLWILYLLIHFFSFWWATVKRFLNWILYDFDIQLKTVILLSTLALISGCQQQQFQVLRIAGTNEIIIDATHKTAKPGVKFDIFASDVVDVPVGRIIITQTTPTYSVGTFVSRLDGSKPQIDNISSGMLCRRTSKQTLKVEKKIYKYQKKALKRQYKLTKIKGKSDVYDSLGKVSNDSNDIDSIRAGFIKVDRK